MRALLFKAYNTDEIKAHFRFGVKTIVLEEKNVSAFLSMGAGPGNRGHLLGS